MKSIALLAVLSLSLLTFGCDKEDRAKASAALDKAAEQSSEKLEKAVSTTKEKLQKAGEDIKKALD